MNNFKVGDIVEGQVTGVNKYGVFVSLEDNYVGMVHISEVSNRFVSDLPSLFSVGNIIRVKVIEIDENKLQVKLSIKKIDIKPKKKISKIEEKGLGFKAIENEMDGWISKKIEELR